MFSLIIAIISIALIVAVIAVGGYFGGDAVSDAQAKVQASRLISEESQILASMDMFNTDFKRWPLNVEELVSTGYLRSIPQGARSQVASLSAPAALLIAAIPSAHAEELAPELGWSMPVARQPVIYTTTQVPKTTCRQYNKASRGDDGILKKPFDNLLTQCYGTDGSYQVLVRKTAVMLSAVLPAPSDVANGDMPTSDNDEWWDTPPTGEVTAPVDPDKIPKPELVLSSSSLSFGQVQVGQEMKSSQLTVSNRGKRPASALAVRTPAGFNVVDNNCASELATGATCSFAVSFTPSQAQGFTGAVVVAASKGAPVQASLSGDGEAPAAELAAVDFGAVTAGTKAFKDAVLRNTGVGPLTIGSASVAGTGFEVASGGSCGSSLAVGASCTIKLGVLTSGIERPSGTLTVQSGAGDQRANLSGQSYAAILDVSPAASDIGNVQVGYSLASNTVHTVTNAGNLASGPVSLTAPSGFSVNNSTCSGVLPIGGTCSFRVAFAPTAAGAYASNLSISGATVGTSKVALTGSGVSASASVTGINFGDLMTGEQRVSDAIVRNTGIGPVTIGVATVSGTGFSKAAGSTCGGPLAVGASCTVKVALTAAGVTAHTGTVSVVTNEAGTVSAGLSAQSRQTFTVNQTATTTGSVVIPAGVTSLKLTGKGAAGYDNTWYDPGQPYIAAVAARPAKWDWSSGGWYSSFVGYNPGLPSSDSKPAAFTTPAGTGVASTTTTSYQTGPSGGVWTINQHTWNVVNTDPGSYAVAGQPYIAPSSGGSVTTGASATATVAGVVSTFAGGYGGGASTTSVTKTLSGAAQTLSYTIPSGGSVNYQYSYTLPY